MEIIQDHDLDTYINVKIIEVDLKKCKDTTC